MAPCCIKNVMGYPEVFQANPHSWVTWAYYIYILFTMMRVCPSLLIEEMKMTQWRGLCPSTLHQNSNNIGIPCQKWSKDTVGRGHALPYHVEIETTQWEGACPSLMHQEDNKSIKNISRGHLPTLRDLVSCSFVILIGLKSTSKVSCKTIKITN